MNSGRDDEKLLTVLREALAARDAVPRAFTEAARNAYAWHNIDAELAQLTYDSRRDTTRVAAVRSESASIRALTFHSARFSIEVEITDDGLLGQIIPPQRATVEIQTLAGQTSATRADDIGCFSIEPKPDTPFRMRLRAGEQPDVLTGWLTL